MFATIEKACVLNGAQAHGYESTFAEVSSYVARLSGSPIYSESYVRDNLGRITQRTEVLQGVTTVWGYGYDVAGRLVSVTRNGAAFESYTFDANDNRLTKTTTAGTTTYAHDDQDRLLSAVGPDGAESWVYDGHGDLLSHNGSAGQTSFDYETGGQLLSLTRPDGDVVSYDMDAGNKRAVKRVNGVVQGQWLYAGGLLPVAELDGSGNLVAVFNGGFMVKNGTTYRLLRDHLGSVRLVVDAGTGTVVQRLSYGPWGEVLEDTNPGFQPFGFAGGLYDPDTGLVRFGVRDYDPSAGRWTCKDPIGLSGGKNLYAYCENTPVNGVDITGLEFEVYYSNGTMGTYRNTSTFLFEMNVRDPGEIAGVRFHGHSGTKHQTFSSGENQDYNSGYLEVNEDGRVMLGWSEDNEAGQREQHYRDLKSVLGRHKLRFIELLGCDTAGGPNRDQLKKLQKMRPWWSGYKHDIVVATDDNISYYLANELRGTYVTGHAGPQFGYEMDNPVTYIYGASMSRVYGRAPGR